MKHRFVCLQILGLILATGACSMASTHRKMPLASDALNVPTALPNKRLFDCAQSSILELSRTSSSWPEVTLRNDSHGILESGDFGQDDKTGFRMRIERPSGTGLATIALKGAGAYYFDLGVDQAMKDLKATMQHCISGTAQ